MATGLLQNLIGNIGQQLTANPATAPKQQLAQAQASASKLTANTLSPTPAPSLGVKSVAPAMPSVPKTLTKAQTAPTSTSVSQYGPSVTNSTENSAQNTPAYGSTFYDPKTGQAAGTNLYDPNTGQPLKNPNVTPDTTTQAQNTAQYNNQNPTFTQAVGGLAGANLANKAITDNTQNQVNQTAQEIDNLRKSTAGNVTADLSSLGGQQAFGAAQLAQNNEAAQESALQGQLTNQLQGGAQALTGQAQTQAAQQSTAALAAPQQNYPFVFNPTTGQYTNATTGGVMTPADAAQQVLSGKMSYADAANGLGYIGSTSASQLQQAILAQNPSANLNQLEAGSTVQQQNAVTSGTVGTNINAANQTTLGTTPVTTNAAIGAKAQQQGATLQQSLSQFSNIGSQATSFLTSNLSLNPTQIGSMNEQIGTYMANVKNPAAQNAYTAIANEVQTLQSAIANGVASGAITPSANDAKTASTPIATMPINQLQTFLSTLSQIGQNDLAPIQSTVNNAYGSGTTPYAGNTAAASSSAPTITPNTIGTLGITPMNSSEAASGTGMNIIGDVGNFFSGIGTAIAHFF